MKNEFKKKYKKLCKIYKKELGFIELAPKDFNFFVTYIKFLRDYFLLTEPLKTEDKENPKILALQRLLLIYKEYCLNSDLVAAIEADPNSEEDLESARMKKQMSWMSFWKVVIDTGESWLI